MNQKTMAPSMWRRSSRCERAACVWVAMGSDRIGLRDERHTVLRFSPAAWEQFVGGLKDGGFATQRSERP